MAREYKNGAIIDWRVKLLLWSPKANRCPSTEQIETAQVDGSALDK